ncbi:rhomboid family intramembrane serine protease [Pedobacter yulinensis]|uniref:Rhomboid family intramembrane serine protease n=1 Tax=Pedobacter yulinensis TaxID=2126353 RepID=A0A2T3HRZ8_9SPHI|nr:rhomboid family intramembrane serine protease [Pedobacter yulinensis]PST85186.1 rhomboid family intramembrane serine protease [Pedobacter yulinensis]
MNIYLQAAPVASFVFVLTLITSLFAFYNTNVYGKLMLHPYSVSRGAKPWTVVTSGLIHADWAHLFFNMMTFFFFAFSLEAQIGSLRFGIIYFAGMILADIPSILKHKDHFWYNSLGASGAISAILFSYILFDPLMKLYIMFIPIGIPAVLFGGLYLIYCVYMSKNSRDNINHDAHFFGALAGLALTVLFVPGIIAHFLNALLGRG